MWERRGDEDNQRTAILTQLINHTVLLYSKPCLALLLLSWGRVSFCSSLGTHWHSPCHLTARPCIWDCDYKSDCICCGWLHIWFHNAYVFLVCLSGCQPTHLLPPVYTGAFHSINPQLTSLSKVDMQQMYCLHIHLNESSGSVKIQIFLVSLTTYIFTKEKI